MKKNLTAKLWNVMRVCAVQAVAAITLCGVALSHPDYAQLLDKEITITMTDLPFERALKELEKVAQVQFAYSIDQLEDVSNVSLSIEKRTLRDVLEELLTPRNIRYKVHEKDAVITLRKLPGEGDTNRSSVPDETNGDERRRRPIQISGTVTESSAQTAMAGVNVLIKGSTNGTTTDVNGAYTISADDNDVLVFSFIGYVSLEIPVNGRAVINVMMQEDLKNLGEVVINAGYWEVSDQERTGNISRITSDEISRQPVYNPLQSLQGRMPGVYVQQNTGVPGGAFKVQIRGENSLRPDGNDPLYVIDGIPFTSTSLTSPLVGSSIIQQGNPLSSINPGDIESIEILKDADATAIYGSRGANGVVLITTKKGKEGKTIFDLNVYHGVAKVSNMLDLLNTEQYVTMRREGLMNQGIWPIPPVIQWVMYDMVAWDTTRYTDWQKELIGGTAHTTNAQFSISGGTRNTQFIMSGGYYRETTVYDDDYYFHRAAGSLGVTHASTDGKFKASVSVNFTTGRNVLLPIDLTSIAVSLPPNAPALYDEDGNINWDWKNGFMQNPLSHLKKKYESRSDNILANSTVRYDILPGLQIKASLGFTSMWVDELSTNPLSAIPPQFFTSQRGSSTFSQNTIRTWIAEPQTSYTKTLGRGTLGVMIGGTFQGSVLDGQALIARGYTSDALLENIRAATSIETASANYSEYRYCAVFGRVNYSYDNRYLINLTGRRDGSSRFGPGRQFGNFGAVGAGWIFSNERFIADDQSFLSFGKLRMSYGITGSDAIGNYQYLDTYSPTGYPYNGTPGLVVTRLDNPDYSWETNKKFEVGLELGFIRDHVYFSASWYNNRSTDQLVGLPLPVITGQSSVQFNLPATVENKGWEFLLNSRNFNRANFKWTSSLNITLPKNRLIEFPNIEAFPAYNNLYKIGKSIFTKKTLRYNGVDPETGVYTFDDTDGDGSLSVSKDGVFLKEIAQQCYGGLNNSFTYRGIQLDIFFQFVKQTGYNYRRSFSYPGAVATNQPVDVVDRWQKPGDITSVQKYTFGGVAATAYTNYRFSDAAVSDASFIRFKSISLSWELPWLKKSGIQSKVYVQGQNLLTMTDYLGTDPENQNANVLPPLRVLTAGIQITL